MSIDSDPGTVAALAAVASEDWVTGREVAKVTGLSVKSVRWAAEKGYLTVRRPPPGMRGLVRYSRSSAQALAVRMVTFAHELRAGSPDGPQEPPR